MNRILIIFLLASIALADVTEFEVSLLGMHVADVTMSHDLVTDETDSTRNSIRIHFTSTTTAFASKVYPVDGRYTVIVDPETYHIQSFFKQTSQPRIENTISTERTANGLVYTGTDILIPVEAFTIFSLLDYLALHDGIVERTFLLDREGRHYHAEVIVQEVTENTINYQLMISTDSDSLSKPVLEKTDIFTWAVYKPSAKRFIEVDRMQHRIIRCEFSFGLMTLTAKVKDK